MQEIRTKYSFLTAPKDEEILAEPPKTIELKHGKFSFGDRLIIVDKLSIFRDGIAADCTSSTDDTDHFLDDLTEWTERTLPKLRIVQPRYYLSHIEFVRNEPLGIFAPRLQLTGTRIQMLLESYGITTSPRYEVTAINLHYDQIGKLDPKPGVFLSTVELEFPSAPIGGFPKHHLEPKITSRY